MTVWSVGLVDGVKGLVCQNNVVPGGRVDYRKPRWYLENNYNAYGSTVLRVEPGCGTDGVVSLRFVEMSR